MRLIRTWVDAWWAVAGPIRVAASTTSAAASVVAGARKRLVHDLADRAGAPAALRATAEAAVDLSGRARRRRRFDCRPHVVVGQHIAGADNHLRVPGFHPELCWY